jgi:hypothetical protein
MRIDTRRETVVLINIVERCYELANSGQYEGTEEIRRQLLAEGYTHAEAGVHLSGRVLKRTLSELCRAARREAETSSR